MDFSNQKDKLIYQKDINRKIQRIAIKEIDFIIGKKKDSVFFIGSKAFGFPILIGEMERRFEGMGFFRIRREKIINMARFDRIISYEKREIVLTTGDKFIVSRRNFTKFKTLIIS